MTLRNKLAISVVSLVAAGSMYVAKPSFRAHSILAPVPAYAQQSGKYSKNTKPLAPDSAIKGIAKKAKSGSGSDLESARKLRSILEVDTAGGLRISKSARSDTEDEPPKSAARTMKEGGDCSEFAYVVMSALNEMGIKSGIIILDLGKGLLHVIAYAEIDGKKYLVDPQINKEIIKNLTEKEKKKLTYEQSSDFFGLGAATVNGKTIVFTYEQVKTLKAPKFLRETTFDKAAGAWHYEWGAYLEGKGDMRGAHSAYSEALRIDPGDFISQKKLNYVSAKIFNSLMQKAGKAFESKQWKKAGDLSEEALPFIPESMGRKGKASLHGNIGSCRYNSGEFAKAAEHFQKAYELSGNEKYKEMAEAAKAKAKE